MSRRRKATKRAILPDPLHGSPLVGSLVNAVMFSGKKSLAQRIVYKAIEKMAEKVGKGMKDALVATENKETGRELLPSSASALMSSFVLATFDATRASQPKTS